MALVPCTRLLSVFLNSEVEVLGSIPTGATKVMTILYTVKNVCKILIWLALIPMSLSVFGLFNGILAYVSLTVLWSLGATFVRAWLNKEPHGIKEIFKSTVSGNYLLPFTVYGYYCSPKYGVDGNTNGLEPIDGLDHSCKFHDETMLSAESDYSNYLISLAEYKKIKNSGDIHFIKSAITSNNTASGIYLLGLIVGFTARVVLRKLFL